MRETTGIEGKFKFISEFNPAGDQLQAIDGLSVGVSSGKKIQTLKGVTGSGKTFTIGNVIERVQLPTLVISHNKTLAAQLYREFKEFFPENAVEYFVSYYDYYQPEAYLPSKDLYIEKDASINDEIDRLRLAATSSLLERTDVIVISTVSCIYGLGNPASFFEMRKSIRIGEHHDPAKLARELIGLQYKRNDASAGRGNFRIKGEVFEVYPAYLQTGYRIESVWNKIERITRIDSLTGENLENLNECIIYPAKHFVMPEARILAAVEKIKTELDDFHEKLLSENRLVEAARIKSRTEYDIEMMGEMGYCTGIENYSRHLSGRDKGERPSVLIDYFPDNFLTIIDESHVALSQIRSMYAGDKARKQSLINYGFRLPSALDNRPLNYSEFEDLTNIKIYVSATPGKEEHEKSDQIVEQLIRPTGLLDPEIIVRPSRGQIEDLYGEVNKRIAKGERILITALTKKMSEDLTKYLSDLGLSVCYLHSDVKTFDRVDILKKLREGKYDIVVGVNLLREGLDLPEVSLIIILDADKIGFLRSSTSLIQIIGRAARNVNGTVIMYADRISDAMSLAIKETNRRREIQREHNKKNGIKPETIKKAIHDLLTKKHEVKKEVGKQTVAILRDRFNLFVKDEREKLIKIFEKEMLEHAKNLEFEEAVIYRDEIDKINEMNK